MRRGDADGARERVEGAPHRGVPGAKRRVRKEGALWAADEQNQLTSMTMKTGLPTGMTRKRLEPDYLLQDSAGLQKIPCGATADPPLCVGTDKAEDDRPYEAVVQFKYDYARRRVEKKVINNWNGSTGTTISHLKYVYDGHNLIAELDASGNSVTVLSTYVWGLDLSGTTWGAGGVGGLLMIKDGSKVYFPGYDGNGNVSGLVDSADGSLDAKYEYGAFGETLRVSGETIAADNPFRYSTKYTDEESGLVYYGYRYYSPSLGRFLNRDPIGELGGSNLYAFVENDPVNGWDYLGYGPDYIGGPDCESECRSYMGEHRYRSFEECMEDLCPGELEPYIVEEVQVPEPYMGLGYLIGEDEDGGGGDGGDGSGPSGNDGCDEEKEEDDRPFWCAAIEGALAANRNIGAAHARLLGLLGIDGNFNLGGSIGGTVAAPFPWAAVLGVGVHGEVGGRFSFDLDDPLNLKFSGLASMSGMLTMGGGGYFTRGPTYGHAEGDLKSGFSFTPHLHSEAAFVLGRGGAAQIDIDLNGHYDPFNDPFDIEEIFEGHSWSFSPRSAYGIAGIIGTGGGVTASFSSESPKEVLQRLYQQKCE